MQFDSRNMLANNLAITTEDTYVPKEYIDLGAPGTAWNGAQSVIDPGRHVHGRINAQVVEDFSGGTSVKAQLVMSDTVDENGLSGTPVVIQETPAIPTASLKTGYLFRLDDLPPGVTKRYLGIQFVSAGTHVAGKITAGLVWGKDTNREI